MAPSDIGRAGNPVWFFACREGQFNTILLEGFSDGFEIRRLRGMPPFFEIPHGGEGDVRPLRQVFLTPPQPSARRAALFWR